MGKLRQDGLGGASPLLARGGGGMCMPAQCVGISASLLPISALSLPPSL
jgi:hypothetical protein